jgi:DNA-binding winged helix-turn-helix (wHTH) protein/tetratricopeptide (TPR) repeat protein
MAVLTFEEFEVDLELFEVRQAGRTIEISRRSFDILVYLMQNHERVVSTDELLTRVWGAQILSRSAIPTAVLALRKALGDDSNSPRFISAIRGRGYRFIGTLGNANRGTRIQGDQSSGDSERVASATFVGRKPELAAIAAAIERTNDRRPQMVFLSGEAGIGKTRTADEAVAIARRLGTRALVGRCREEKGAPAFWPWVQVVRGIIDQPEFAHLSEDFRSIAPILIQMMPEIADRLPGLSPAPVLEAEQARFRLFDALTHLLHDAGLRDPVIIVLDDLHRADPASLQLLSFVSRELRDSKVLFLVTYRDIELERDPPRLSIIAELARQEPSRAICLNGLSASEVAQFVARSGLRDSARDLLARTLFEQSGGNPFFLSQLVHVLEAEGFDNTPPKSRQSARHLPGGIREAVRRQLDGLPYDTRRTLLIAAAMGREFPASAIAMVLGVSTPLLQSSLEPALRARLVAEIPERFGHYRFVHMLVRDSIYDQAAGSERAAIHRQIARVLERFYSDDLDSHAAELAYHFSEAVHEIGVKPAVQYLTRAGDWACARLAYEDGIGHYRTALQVLEQAGPGHVLERCRLLLALGNAEMSAGQREQAIRDLYAAATQARRAASAEHLAQAALRLAPGFFTIEIGVVDLPLVRLLEDALAAMGPGDSVLRAQLLARLAMALAWSGEEERRINLTTEATGVAERIGDPASLAYALSARHGLLWGPRHLADRVRLVEQMGELARQARDTELILMHLLLRIAVGLETRAIDAVDRDIAEYTRIAEPLNQPQSLWYARSFQAMRLSMQGKFEAARPYAEQVLEIGGRVRDVNALNSFGVHAGVHLWELGRAAELARYADQFNALYPSIAGWKFSRAAMHFEAGEVSEARAQFDRLAANGFASIPINEQWSISACLAADLCYWLRDTRRAEALYEILLPGQDYSCSIGFGLVYFGAISRRLANMASLMRRKDEAERYYAHAVAAEERIGAMPWVAHALHDHASMLAGQGSDGARSADMVRRALEITRGLGMTSLTGKLQSLQQMK